MPRPSPEFTGTQDPHLGVADVHRWYLFTVQDGSTARVGVTRDAAASWRRVNGGDEAELDAWAVSAGEGALRSRDVRSATDIVIDVHA